MAMRLFKSSLTAIIGGILLTSLLIWGGIHNFRSAAPVAHSILYGLSLSLGQAIESVATRDLSLQLLADFNSRDIAYFLVLDEGGIIRFHTNHDLIGEPVGDTRYLPVLNSQIVTQERVRLGTGEEVFEVQQQLHTGSRKLVLRLALHTWQADQVIRRARSGLFTLFTLIAAAWILGLLVLRMQRHDLRQREQLAHQQHLAQIGQLGAILAHEVRTPLAGIKGFAQLLGEKLTEARQQSYASRIIGESQRLETLVNDLLCFARQDSPPTGSSELTAVIQQTWEGLSAGNTANTYQLAETSHEIMKIGIPADQLSQILLNLFSNARQAMPDGGIIKLETTTTTDHVMLSISDNGPGFASNIDPERLFDPFYTTRPNGSGLGLAICRKLIESYGGMITACNRPSGGATFTLQLPLDRG